MQLISKIQVPQGYSVSKFLDQKGYRYNNNYIYLTSYQNNNVYILLVKEFIYTIVVIDGYRYIFEMDKDVYGVMDEFEEEIKQTVLPTDGEVELD